MDKTDEVDTNQRRGSLASLNRSQRRGSLASLYRSPNRNRTRSPSRLSISTIASIRYVHYYFSKDIFLYNF